MAELNVGVDLTNARRSTIYNAGQQQILVKDLQVEVTVDQTMYLPLAHEAAGLLFTIISSSATGMDLDEHASEPVGTIMYVHAAAALVATIAMASDTYVTAYSDGDYWYILNQEAVT